MFSKNTKPLSEEWQRPSGVIKLKVKKRRTTDKSSKTNILKPLNSNEDVRVVAPVKRRNPFGCSPRKRAKNLESEGKSQADNKLFRALNNEKDTNTNKNAKPEHDENGFQKRSENEVVIAPRQSKIETDQPITENPNEETDESVTNKGGIFPVDWGLKTKVRFTSPHTFSWSSSLKSSELAEGNSSFVRCENGRFDDLSVVGSGEEMDSARMLLYKTSKTWIHPSIPWLKLFPRRGSQEKLGEGKAKSQNVFVDEDLARSLQADWVGSFHSVFNLLRCGHCPYFYLCANQCTMVFRAAGFANDADVNVVITPTTKGFREALTREGIEYILPHSSKGSSSGPDDCSDSEDEIQDNEEENAGDEEEWLESIGLEKIQFPTFEPHKLTKHQSAKIRNADQNPSSTVLVKGADTQAFFNFILNWRSIIAKNGTLAGVPPTLIAPVAFEGATLRSMKVNQGVVRQQQSKGLQQLYSLDVTGALLPSTIHDICAVLKSTQKGSFTATFMHHHNSTALNIPSVPIDCQSFNHQQFGMSPELGKYFHQTEGLVKEFLKEVTYKDGVFFWKSCSAIVQ